MSARDSKDEVLKETMWNVIDSNSMSRLINSIDIIFPIKNEKLADLTMFLLTKKTDQIILTLLVEKCPM